MALPKTVRVRWDARPAEDAVTAYEVSINGVVKSATPETEIAVEIPAPGTYTATVVARNAWGDSVPSGPVELKAALPGQVVNVTFVAL
jgi:hypothetical protein